jgi:ubiquinone/menaquinone biosynthesis C-methylase UbiE
MDSNDLQRKYDDWHQAVHGGESGLHLDLKQWHHDALSLAPQLSGKTVLEVGCGAGDFAFALEIQEGLVTAVDFSGTAIDVARRKAARRGSKVAFQQADACHLPFAEDCYDVVFSCECLEHLPDPVAAVEEMARVLKPGGTLVLTTENYSNAMVLMWLKCVISGQPFNSGESIQPIEKFFVFPMIYRMFHRAGLRMVSTKAAHHVFLILPRLHPHRFVVERFSNPMLARLLKPLGRHWTYKAVKLLA